MTREVISTSNAPKPGGAYSQGIRWDQLIFTAGMVGSDPATGQPISDNVREQTRQVLRNVQAVLEAAGSGLDYVLKTFNEVYREFFPVDPPARSTIQVGLVPPWRVEIEVMAVRRGQ